MDRDAGLDLLESACKLRARLEEVRRVKASGGYGAPAHHPNDAHVRLGAHRRRVVAWIFARLAQGRRIPGIGVRFVAGLHPDAGTLDDAGTRSSSRSRPSIALVLAETWVPDVVDAGLVGFDTKLTVAAGTRLWLERDRAWVHAARWLERRAHGRWSVASGLIGEHRPGGADDASCRSFARLAREDDGAFAEAMSEPCPAHERVARLARDKFERLRVAELSSWSGDAIRDPVERTRIRYYAVAALAAGSWPDATAVTAPRRACLRPNAASVQLRRSYRAKQSPGARRRGRHPGARS